MKFAGFTAFILALSLPTVAQNYGATPLIAPPCVERELACGRTTDAQLPVGTCRTECGEDSEFWKVQIFAQTTLATVTAVSEGFDPRLDLFDKEGALVASNDNVGGTTTAQISRVLEPGAYSFRVVGRPAGSTGNYRISLGCILSDRQNFCLPDDETICLGGRFSFKVTAREHDGSAPIHATARTPSELHGFFSFPSLTGNPDNPEVFVKLIDGRAVNGHWWVFWGGLTNLDYDITVRDSITRKEKTFHGQGSDTETFTDP